MPGPTQLAPQQRGQLVRRDGPIRLFNDVPRRQVQHSRRLHRRPKIVPAVPLQCEKIQQHLNTQAVAHIRQIKSLFPGFVVHYSQI